MAQDVVTDLDKCLRLANVADEITMRHYKAVSLHVETKPDNTPVSAADLEVDHTLHDIVTKEFGDAYLTEEGDQTHVTGRQWIADPIDGTKNFIRHNPVWGTLLSLQDDSGTLVAVVSAPALGRRWWAARGQGAWTRDVDGTIRQIHVSKVAKIEDSFQTFSSLMPWEDTPAGLEGVMELLRRSWRGRGFGDFLGHVFVAEGAADSCIEPNVKEWDMAAHFFIVEEAGGATYTNKTPEMAANEKRYAITSNGLIHDELLHALKLQPTPDKTA